METLFDALPLETRHRLELGASSDPSWRFGIGYSDFLRFEQVMAAVQATIDPSLSILEILIADAKPNQYHYQLARLLSAKHIVLTTNFDTLIETAASNLGISFTALITEDDYRRYRESPASHPNPIFKLHGSIAAGGDPSETTLATIHAVIDEPVRSPQKWRAVIDVLSSRNLLVLGYSGSDTFDVMPAIADAPARSSYLLWVQHARAEDWMIQNATQGLNTKVFGTNLSRYVQRRLFESERVVKRPAPGLQRQPQNVAFCASMTQEALDALVGETAVPGGSEGSILASLRIARMKSSVSERVRRRPVEATTLCSLLFRHIGLYGVAFHYASAVELRHECLNERAIPHLFACASDMHWERGNVGLDARYARDMLSRAIDLKQLSLTDRVEFSRVLHQARQGRADPLVFCEGSRGTISELQRFKRRLEIEYIAQELRAVVEGEDYDPSDAGLREAESLLLNAAGGLAELSREQRADYFYFINMVRARMELESLRKGVIPVESQTDDVQLIEAARTYEELVRYRKWADTKLLHGQIFLANGFPDWAYDAAVEAMAIFEKIGNEYAREHTIAFIGLARQKMTLLGKTLRDTESGKEVSELEGRYVYFDRK